jgi:hypothetical protein
MHIEEEIKKNAFLLCSEMTSTSIQLQRFMLRLFKKKKTNNYCCKLNFIVSTILA